MDTLPPQSERTWNGELVNLSYRELQSKAKLFELPCNLKHNILIELIKARWSGNEDSVQRILTSEKFERAKRKGAKKLLKSSSSSPHPLSPQVKRLGRPRKRSLDQNFTSESSGNPGADYHGTNGCRLTSLPVDQRNVPSLPMAHSIQQLLKDYRVPNSLTRKSNIKPPPRTLSSHTRRYMRKTIQSAADNTSSAQIFHDFHHSENAVGGMEEGMEYTGTGHQMGQQHGFFSNNSQVVNEEFKADDLPDLANLLTNTGPMTSSSLYSGTNQLMGDSGGTPSYRPSLFLRSDLWPPSFLENTCSGYQGQSGTSHSQPQTHYDYNWPIWNSSHFSPYYSNPSDGYTGDLTVSETQNSDTLSAPENPDYLPSQIPCYSDNTILPNNNNQFFWPRSDINENIRQPLTDPITSCCTSQSLCNNNQITPADNGSVSHMRVSVVDTQEWTYEYSTYTSELISQQFLQNN